MFSDACSDVMIYACHSEGGANVIQRAEQMSSRGRSKCHSDGGAIVILRAEPEESSVRGIEDPSHTLGMT